ncbi:MAG: hypothetical protein AAF628_10375 [Planctomycetota bacterium]
MRARQRSGEVGLIALGQQTSLPLGACALRVDPTLHLPFAFLLSGHRQYDIEWNSLANYGLSLVGLTLHAQALLLDSSTPGNPFATSDAYGATIGGI